MNWIQRLLGKHEPKRIEDEDLDDARKRRRQLMTKMIALGVEADVILSREEKENHAS